ncbi:MAG: tRNA lysidine(34) synthetase TilS [Pelagimonas sp.]|jgi:tRNA(Ile)-lysidine synthase|nr:tRNA lysidine(34) synthetase TilS [Pelagimonas sp.]
MSLDQRFADAMGDLLGPDFPDAIGLAVSGGGDSMAMLTLAHNWAHRWGVTLWVVTVDHGLRAEAAAEAALVAEECAALGHPHAVLRWHWDGAGNKMDAARRGRLALIDQWRGVLRHVLMAHTLDDVAETFLMRLKRGSGVEGLAAMSARREVRLEPGRADPEDFDGDLPPRFERRKGMQMRPGSFQVIRPCLQMTREELRHYLRVLQGRWVEDPSNDDPAYDRVRMRQALPVLAELGLDVGVLAGTANRMARAREALTARALQVWHDFGQEGRVGHVATGEILLTRDGFERVERDTQMRLLAAALQYVSGDAYRPRAEPLEALLDRLLGGGGGTLHGCEAVMERDQLRIFREYKAVADLAVPHAAQTLWDGRWQVFSQQFRDLPNVQVCALGEAGWQQIKDRPEGAPAHRSARSLPALWQGDRLLACDALGYCPGATTRLKPLGRELHSFTAFLLSH